MAQRGGPWRLAGYTIPDGAVTHGTNATRARVAREGDRVVRWIVRTYVLGLVGGGLVALIGLSAGWW
jgi:hypothetical protein